MVLRSCNIVNDQFDLSDLVRVKTTVRENQFAQKNDILICARNGSRSLVGKCALIPDLGEPASFGAFMAIYRTGYFEFSDTTHLARSESTAHRAKKQQHHQIANRSRSPAGARRLGTATRISASLSRRLSAFFESTSRPRSQSGKVRRSDTRPGDVCERAERSESSDTTPIRNSPCFGVCAVVCDSLSRAGCVPTFACESKRGPFVSEVEKRLGTALWR